jgi:hypothetical protein
VCAKHAEWSALDVGAQAERAAARACAIPTGRHDRMDPETTVVRDGETMGRSCSAAYH